MNIDFSKTLYDALINEANKQNKPLKRLITDELSKLVHLPTTNTSVKDDTYGNKQKRK